MPRGLERAGLAVMPGLSFEMNPRGKADHVGDGGAYDSHFCGDDAVRGILLVVVGPALRLSVGVTFLSLLPRGTSS